MNANKIIVLTFFAGLIAFSFSSCKKSYFDINKDPNNAADADIQQLLPSAEAAIAVPLGNNFHVFGGIWGQYWTQNFSSSQYKSYEQNNPAADDFDRPWRALYANALIDLNFTIEKATAQQKPNYVACAKILQAYTFQLLTDNFGDIPFSEALKAESGNFSPHYDAQKDVYDGIITLLKDGLSQIDLGEDAVTPGADDLLLQGDMELWQKFGNTLLLKVYLRLSEVDPGKAQQGIMELSNSGALFLAEGETVKINYTTQGGNTHPLNAEMVGLNNTQNLVASSTAVDYMNNTNDLRVFAFYNSLATGVVGIPQGAYDLPVGTPVSYPADLTGANTSTAEDADASATAPVIFMSSYESLFLQSEAMARGWMSGDAQSLYEAGITESFLSLGFEETDVSDYDTATVVLYPAGGSMQDKVKAIITQKWVAMCGTQNDEAWIEWRRTGYPDFFVESKHSNIGAGRFPVRFFYPSTEVTRNVNFPGQKFIYDKVWWDVN